KMTTDEGDLVEVVPPPSELRYIRAEAVSTMPVTTASAASAPAGAAPRWQPAAGTPQRQPGPAPAPQSRHPRPGAAQPTAAPLPLLSRGWSTPAGGWLVSPPGRLTLADHRIDDQEGFLLLNSQGIPIVYATARPGYTLRSYLDRNLELRGVRQWRDDLRAFHMTVMEVRLIPSLSQIRIAPLPALTRPASS